MTEIISEHHRGMPGELRIAIEVEAYDPELGLFPQGFPALRDFVFGRLSEFPDAEFQLWLDAQLVAQARAAELLDGITLDPANLPAYFTADWYRMLSQPWAEGLVGAVAIAEEQLA